MSGTTKFKQTAAVFVLWALVMGCGYGITTSRLSSRFLARGEQALLGIACSQKPSALPEIPDVEGIRITPYGRGVQPRLLPGRKFEYVIEYLVSGYDIGTHVIPSFTVDSGGTLTRSEPLEFSIFNPDELKWSEVMAGNTKIRYASSFRILDTSPYDGQSTPVEIKVFVPRDLMIADYGIPVFERDGVTAWRFQPSPMRGSINLLGMPYISISYPSTLRSIRAGDIAIGPASVRLITTQSFIDGIPRRENVAVNLEIPTLRLNARPLPEGAPDGFVNAVGDFRLELSSSVTKIQEGDPIPVKITVSGTGNLDALRPPAPIDTNGWKLYDTTTEQRGAERRKLSGRTIFHQFMRPLEIKTEIPPFRLVYFDPKLKTYKTLITSAIPLEMSPMATPNPANSIAPPQALDVPVERMTDILGILRPANLINPRSSRIPRWLWHLAAALIAIALIGRAFWRRHGHSLQKDPVRTARIKDLQEIERIKNSDDISFLMSTGRFIERWLGENPSPEVQAVLAERDAACFLKEKPNTPLLDSKRRGTILKTLRKAAQACILISCLAAVTASARAEGLRERALDAYDSALYEDAMDIWLHAGPYEDLSSDTLYNIGNASYRAGSPGYAALYYRRALARDSAHQESRQNLRFIERKYGALTIHRPEFQNALTFLTLSTWKNLLWAGAWLCLLAVLIFPATRPGSKLRIAACIALIIAPLLAASGSLGWHYYPDDSKFAKLTNQAVIIADNAVLYSDASRTSTEVIDAPPGSLCEVVHESGQWIYVAFASKTRGWIPAKSIERVIPTAPPEAPGISKPTADEKRA
jgi:hypothetical protein